MWAVNSKIGLELLKQVQEVFEWQNQTFLMMIASIIQFSNKLLSIKRNKSEINLSIKKNEVLKMNY